MPQFVREFVLIIQITTQLYSIGSTWKTLHCDNTARERDVDNYFPRWMRPYSYTVRGWRENFTTIAPEHNNGWELYYARSHLAMYSIWKDNWSLRNITEHANWTRRERKHDHCILCTHTCTHMHVLYKI